ncbi:ferredoxin [Advenella kashmirensis WT001]|uniref:Ferredoxin n=1 Tax=Advenella kashmirensis (strain DSM 17095 / LMG 22695 / WT001) TaxID=1036672 RepID=I3UAZ3_ADVKW|nr:PDR/VanB family oxidoreductase [Advenella kashmirensis]AFK62181.1 ferredoxin [Advenella kashmirensis WT001]
MEVIVSRKRLETRDIAIFELIDAQNKPLPAFSAGSHIDVHIPGGLIRQYSLCNSPAESHRYVIAVLRDPSSRGGSNAMHSEVKEGDTLFVSVPRNHFQLVPTAEHSILLAGGIGVTPILCMAEQLSLTGASFELHYCTRSIVHTAFREYIAGSSFSARSRFYFDDDRTSGGLDLTFLQKTPSRNTELYVCGPKGFLDAVLEMASIAGWTDEQVHHELFSAAVSDAIGNTSFQVQLKSNGRIIDVSEDQSVVEALEIAGVTIPVSCEQGLCGTCATRVLSGIPDHRDYYLSPAERAVNDQFLPCCSRARTSPLVLDL